VNHLYKRYQIGERQPYYSFRDSIASAFSKLQKTFTPRGPESSERAGIFWALKDISFKVMPGEVVGIIGRNGAGKSTLLKILSRITPPTKGEIILRGRVASLLEVGTGFHSELTGRENIYLNGAILGMKKAEISGKFNEIVEFSGISKFLDTPVKFYSSGMHMRLAFAIAAHLEPEILLVDEVLAVGDVEFQKKCLGKMEEVSKKYGRTVIFVSHNMGAIINLCKKSILLKNGKLVLYANSAEVINKYLSYDRQSGDGFFIRNNFNSTKDLVISAELLNSQMKRVNSFRYDEDIYILLKTNPKLKQKFSVELRIKNSRQELTAYVSSWINNRHHECPYLPGQTIMIHLPKAKLVQDTYIIDFICRIPYVYHVDNWWDCVNFTITNCHPIGSPIPITISEHLGSFVLSDAVCSLKEE
jgi:lipopolysaccharide transport system ATP-binding protein